MRAAVLSCPSPLRCCVGVLGVFAELLQPEGLGQLSPGQRPGLVVVLFSRLKAWDSACRSPSGCQFNRVVTRGVAPGYAVRPLRGQNNITNERINTPLAREGKRKRPTLPKAPRLPRRGGRTIPIK